MTEKKQYSLVELLTITVATPVIFGLITLVGIPIGLLVAWMRELVWNWFMPAYLHLPHIGLWLMFAVGLLWSMFWYSEPRLKEEHYRDRALDRYLITPLCTNGLLLFVAWLLHLFILKG